MNAIYRIRLRILCTIVFIIESHHSIDPQLIMATKSKRSAAQAATEKITTTITESSSSSVTSTPVSSSSGAQSSTPRERPVSPARMSRIDERFELQNLNDRLASYIERVRNLENENSTLKSQKTVESKEIRTIKKMYQEELKDARGSLDQVAKEKAQLVLLINRTQDDYKALEKK